MDFFSYSYFSKEALTQTVWLSVSCSWLFTWQVPWEPHTAQRAETQRTHPSSEHRDHFPPLAVYHLLMRSPHIVACVKSRVFWEGNQSPPARLCRRGQVAVPLLPTTSLHPNPSGWSAAQVTLMVSPIVRIDISHRALVSDNKSRWAFVKCREKSF